MRLENLIDVGYTHKTHRKEWQSTMDKANLSSYYKKADYWMNSEPRKDSLKSVEERLTWTIRKLFHRRIEFARNWQLT